MSNNIAYDLDGNLTNDSIHAYQWDANGHMIANDTSTFVYDAQGYMVEASWGDQYLYDTNGTLLAGSQAQAPAYVAYTPLPGGATAVYSSGSLSQYKHSDWLGSVRFASTPGHAESYDLAFAPFGEPYASTHIGNIFAGMTQVIAADEYETPNREYNTTQGRWISPDPMRGTGNKYVYADNNPLSKVDPYGLMSIEINGIDYGGADAEFEGDKFKDPLAESESHPPTSTQTSGSADTGSADQGCKHFCWFQVAVNYLAGNGPLTNAEVAHQTAEANRNWYVNHMGGNKDQFAAMSDKQVNDFARAYESGQSTFTSEGQEFIISATAAVGRFATNAQLQGHFADHGSDFGAKTPAEYQQQADRFLNGPRGSGVLEKVRPNGDVVRYNPATDEFGVTQSNGTIRTYFKPDPSVHGYATNLDYFNAQ